MKTVYQDENNVIIYENSVEWKPCINREIKSLDLTIKLYSCHNIKMKFLVVVTAPSIYQCDPPPILEYTDSALAFILFCSLWSISKVD